MATKKSAGKSAPGKPFAPGSDPRRGRGPAKGAPNAGRPTDKDKAYLEELLASRDCREGLRVIFQTGARAPELFLKTWDKVWDKVKSKPPVQIEGGDERKPLTIRLVRE